MILLAGHLMGCAGSPNVDRPLQRLPETAVKGPDGVIVTVVQTKRVASRTILAESQVTSWDTMDDLVKRVMPDLPRTAAEEELQITGPMIFVYDGLSPEDQRFRLTIGLPVETRRTRVGPYTTQQTDSAEVAYAYYRGDLDHLEIAYAHIIDAMRKRRLKVASQVREIYHEYYGPHSSANVVEVQIVIDR